jgi:hypothetical protein
MVKKSKWWVIGVAAVAFAGVPTAADAAWLVGGVWVSNVCRAPSGSFWIYPAYAAAPVGSYCTIYSTGEVGTVTPN